MIVGGAKLERKTELVGSVHPNDDVSLSEIETKTRAVLCIQYNKACR